MPYGAIIYPASVRAPYPTEYIHYIFIHIWGFDGLEAKHKGNYKEKKEK